MRDNYIYIKLVVLIPFYITYFISYSNQPSHIRVIFIMSQILYQGGQHSWKLVETAGNYWNCIILLEKLLESRKNGENSWKTPENLFSNLLFFSFRFIFVNYLNYLNFKNFKIIFPVCVQLVHSWKKSKKLLEYSWKTPGI